MGLTDLISLNDWTIESVDAEVTAKLTGQYQPENVTFFGDPTVTSVSSPGSAEPDRQWVSGGGRGVRFDSRIRANTNLVSIQAEVDTLLRLNQRDPGIGRAPRVVWAWGIYAVTGFVTALQVRPTRYWVTGLLQEAVFSIEITPAPDETESASTGETQHLSLARGETFETYGARYLGSPLRGELIRRINPRNAGRPEQPGDVVKVLEREHPLMRGPIEPQAAPFQDAAWEDLVQGLGESRGVTEQGLSWASLPAVQAGLVSIG